MLEITYALAGATVFLAIVTAFVLLGSEYSKETTRLRNKLAQALPRVCGTCEHAYKGPEFNECWQDLEKKVPLPTDQTKMCFGWEPNKGRIKRL